MATRQTLTSPAIYRWYADQGMHVEIEWVEPSIGFFSVYEVFLNDESIGFVASYSDAQRPHAHETWTWATSRGALAFEDIQAPAKVRLSAVAALVEFASARPQSKDS